MADDVRQRIIASVFSKRNASGSLEEQYIAHVKIFEDSAPGNDDSSKKARYILLSLTHRGPGLIHKSRENPNGSFSIGKSWDLKDLTALEVSGRTPGFDITFARRYRWQTEKWEDQEAFLIATVRLYRRVMGGQTPLLMGWNMPDGPSKQLSLSTTNAPPPRSTSPNLLTPRNVTPGPRSAASGPYDQPSPVGNGRPSVDGKRTPSPSPRSPYDNGASPGPPKQRAYPPRVPVNRDPSPAARGTRPKEPQTQGSIGRESQPSRSDRRPPELDKRSFEGARNQDQNGPSSSRATRPDRVPSPQPPNRDIPSSQQQQQSRYPPPRLEAVPQPQPESSSYRTGGAPSPKRTRADSRSERNASPPPPPADLGQALPSNRSRGVSPNRAAESAKPRSRVGSRPERVPSPKPVPEPTYNDRSSTGPRSERVPSPTPSSKSDSRRQQQQQQQQRSRAGSRSERGPPPDIQTTPRRRAEALVPAPVPQVAPMLEPTFQPPSRPPMPVSLSQGARKDPYARISFYDPVNQAAVDRLLAGGEKGIGEDESNEATLANIEEMLDGYEWAVSASVGGWEEPKGAADQIEARLLKELGALDAANMYSFVESDTRVATVLGFIDEALKELDEMDGSITSYKIHLNAVNDDISYIQSQNRGLQVQTQNQRGLLKELEGLFQTVQVDRESLLMLTSQSLDKPTGIPRLEEAATELYKALQAGRETDMAATMQRLDEGATMRRAGTIVRSPLDRGKDKDKDKDRKGELRGYEAFGRILDQICPITYREEEFLSTFLQINETGETFADYMGLDSYFRRQASRWIGLSKETQKLLRGAMDLIFSFLPEGMKKWVDDVLELDKLQLVGIMAHLERYKLDAEERGNTFLAKMLQRQFQRMLSYHARHLDELIKSIEATKLSSKKRKGVVHYIKYFPIFVNRVEGQLTGADSFEIRTVVDTAYEKLVNSMFESLQQMAKLEGEGEDKGQLNYHIILVENMHSFINELSQQSLGSIAGFIRRAETIYDENISAYVHLVLRRPFQRLVDFVDGAEKLLKTMSPSDVSSNSSYNKAQLKKVIKETSTKDVKRHVDAMFKRVEKHFAEGDENSGGGGPGSVVPGTVLFVVWKACEDEMISITERFLKLIATCYRDSSAEYSVADVESAFKRYRA
ncbi:hypothetical protein FS842_003912 [Serendipita sp. 407]|nr:hypothetical protein FS842_003912 [Serendipita sp. 407]